MAPQTTGLDWEQEFARWVTPFLQALGHKARRRWAPVYLQGLLGPGERKSVQPMAARVAPADHEQLHHFIATSAWDPAPLEAALAREAQRLVGGLEAVLILDDTALVKQGRHSVGVARQYCGTLGKTANCQVLVSLTLARGEVPVPVALRLYLPETWTADPARCRQAGVPVGVGFRPKWQLALEELDRVRAAGVAFGPVLADAGYGTCAEFRRGLSARGLTWAVGILGTQTVYPETVCVRPARRRPGRGRPPTHPVSSAPGVSAAARLAALGPRAFRRLTWRHGTKGPLTAAFAAVRVRPADGPRTATGVHLPGEPAWLVCERRTTGEQKYYLTNHPPSASLRTLATAIKARWVCEQAHQQLKDELGLDHFEGRSWLGLHHHALLTMLALAFLQHWRLRQARVGEKIPPGAPAPADAPGRPPPALRPPRSPWECTLSSLPHAVHRLTPRMKVAK